MVGKHQKTKIVILLEGGREMELERDTWSASNKSVEFIS